MLPVNERRSINMNSMLAPRKIPQKTINEIFGITKEKATDSWQNKNIRKIVIIENLMLRAYIKDPSLNVSDCRFKIQNFCPEYRLDNGFLIQHVGILGLESPEVRQKMSEWAYDITKLIYAGMAGDKNALKKAKALIKEPYCAERRKLHTAQERMIFFSMFEYIPELRKSPLYDGVMFIGKKFVGILLNRIISVLLLYADKTEADSTPESIEELKREVYLARSELAEYKALIEEEDAEYEDKIEELTFQNISSFFSALNNEKYGFIIDTVYLLNKACIELKKDNRTLPFSVQGVPAFLDRLLRFFKDSGISPVCKYAPHSVVLLTLDEMDGFNFEPSPSRKKPIAPGEKVRVTVFSAGWKYKDVVISPPVLHEIDSDKRR